MTTLFNTIFTLRQAFYNRLEGVSSQYIVNLYNTAFAATQDYLLRHDNNPASVHQVVVTWGKVSDKILEQDISVDTVADILAKGFDILYRAVGYQYFSYHSV